MTACAASIAPLGQDSLNADKKVMTWVLDALQKDGTAVVRARFVKRRLLPPNISPLGDLTKSGAWAALTGQELWVVSSVFPIVMAPIFADARSLVRIVYRLKRQVRKMAGHFWSILVAAVGAGVLVLTVAAPGVEVYCGDTDCCSPGRRIFLPCSNTIGCESTY